MKDSDPDMLAIAQTALGQITLEPQQKEFQVKGVLTKSDPFDRVRGGCHHVVYVYPMKAGRTYTIDLLSTWDNYLRLKTAQGVQLAENDDGGGFPNARILFQPPQDGWYRIIVTSCASGLSGPYTLKVR